MENKQKNFYDDPGFDYQEYWQNREYENRTEQIAIKKLLDLIPNKKNKSLIDIGAGFGRLCPLYSPLFKKCLLVEPSGKGLEQAKEFCSSFKNITYQQAFIEHLPIPDNSFDVALIIRVSHHLSDIQEMIKEIKRILKPGGFAIMEYANKIHFKNLLEAFFHLDWEFFTSHQPVSLRSSNRRAYFYNYHPNQIRTLAFSQGFTILKRYSVSNFRNPFLKKVLPLSVMLFLEKTFEPLATWLRFGPSIIGLAQKEK